MIQSHGLNQSAEGIGATLALANFIAGFPATEIPASVFSEARLTLLNYLGCTIAGTQHDTVSRILAAYRPFFGAPQAALLGLSEKADVLHAALVNGTANNVYGFDDTHLESFTHPGAPVLSAILALAALREVSIEDLLAALVIGVEVTCRVASALGAKHIDAGWHISSTAGTFGAAAAAARLMQLPAERITQLLAIVASQPTGMRANFGTMTVSLHIGLAARNGLAAALLAGEGFSAHEALLEFEEGWGKTLSPEFDPARMTEGLGTNFAIAQNSYKPYASGIVTHPIIDGCIDLAEAHGLKPEDVAAISLRTHPLVQELTGRMPTSALRSKVSVQHAAAVGLARRSGGIAEFSAEALHDPQIAHLRALVALNVDETLARDAAEVVLTLSDGRELTRFVPHARGSAARPMLADDLRRKVFGLTAGILPEDQVRALAKLCLDPASRVDARQILLLSCPMTERSDAVRD